MRVVIGVSTSRTSSLFLQLDAVDHEVRLFQDGGDVEVFSAMFGDGPHGFPLHRSSGYLLRYNNNDGADGCLRFEVLEIETMTSAPAIERYRIDIGAINGPHVLEIGFRFQADVGV
jgi:hypothetical protein